MTYLCEHCGGRIPDDAIRCPGCGSTSFLERGSVGKGQPARVEPVKATPAAAPRAKGARPLGAHWVVLLVLLVVGASVALSVANFVVRVLVGTPGSSKESAPAVAAPADPWATAKARGKLLVAADPDAPPFLEQKGGGWEGFEYAVANAIGGAAGVPVEIVPTAFSDLAARVNARDADLAIGQLAPRGGELTWSVSYLQYTLCLLEPEGTTRALAELRGARIALWDDPVARDAIESRLGRDWVADVVSERGYLERLGRRELDAMVYDCPLARHELAAGKQPVHIVDDGVGMATYSVGLYPGDADLKGAVDRVLVDLGNQGLLQKLEERWLGARTAASGVVVVLPGDTLEKLAERELGGAARADELYQWNQDILGSDRGALYAGMRLRVRR